ncbi:MAG: imidazolonepropionase [Acidobacteria bacterium OLB17]|nr:MAG: imidazolonepropionase [Acidobacteria bacterium OLB17]MCZ2392033.1 imidazolonepropionase [Acidobacteriota bacterium]
MKADLIVGNIGQLASCSSPTGQKRGREVQDVGLIENAAVAIAGGRILTLGSDSEIRTRHTAAEFIDAESKVITPGLVDPHTHIVFAGDRLSEFELKIKGAEYLEMLAAGGGIISTVKATRAATEGELVEGALKRLNKMLACGTTTCEIKTGYGLDTETELKMLRVVEELDRTHPIDIVPTFLAAHTVPPEFKDQTDAYVDLICGEMLPAAREWYAASHFSNAGTPFFCDIFTERNAFDAGQTARLLEAARVLGFGIKAHVDQFTNLGGSRIAIENGAASIDHLDVISDDEIALLAESDCVGIVIPTENFSGGKTQFAPARKLIDSGCAVAISTDFNPGSAPCPSQQMAMAIACRYQKLLPAEVMNAATINAAFAIGVGSTRGSIAPGKRADLVIWDANDYRQIAYEFGRSAVDTVIKSGTPVYRAAK